MSLRSDCWRGQRFGLQRFGLLLAAGLLLLLGLALPGMAFAAAGAWGHAEMADARLVSAVTAAGDGVTVPLGLELNLKPGWKTYWRSPGDAGLPPRLDWAGSVNLAGAELAWPVPIRFSAFGLDTVGYEGQVVFPITARRADVSQPLVVQAGLEVLVCHDVCVPAHFDLALTVPLGEAAPAEQAGLIARFARQVPGDGRADGLTLTGVWHSGTELVVEARSREPLVNPDLFVESSQPLVVKPPLLQLDQGDHHLIARLPVIPGGGMTAVEPLAGQPVTVTLVDGVRLVEAVLTVEAGRGPAAGSAGADQPALGAMLALALLGGLILNLMPCVLPVLALKLLAVLNHGGGSQRAVRASFLASAAGILATFLAMAGVLVGLKSAGAAVGWGIQFQQPGFLAVMALVVAAFAANLWGLFEIPLPRFIAALAERSGQSRGLAGAFVTGVFATLLATPCSAPFLGTAVGFALARGPFEIVAVFLLLGLGLALPYLAVAAVPRLATLLPRPGGWMLGVRRLLGVALAGTALWLASLVAVPLLVRAPAALVGTEAVAAPSSWQAFDLDVLKTAVTAGKVVFVDVGADWCLTCIVNHRLVLDRLEVAQQLHNSSGNVVAMRADWTRPDERISRYLASFGRYGVPFDAVYGPGAPDGLALSELLGVSDVLEALRKAAGEHRP